jgi:hypothetical protein
VKTAGNVPAATLLPQAHPGNIHQAFRGAWADPPYGRLGPVFLAGALRGEIAAESSAYAHDSDQRHPNQDQSCHRVFVFRSLSMAPAAARSASVVANRLPHSTASACRARHSARSRARGGSWLNT